MFALALEFFKYNIAPVLFTILILPRLTFKSIGAEAELTVEAVNTPPETFDIELPTVDTVRPWLASEVTSEKDELLLVNFIFLPAPEAIERVALEPFKFLPSELIRSIVDLELLITVKY